MPRGCLADPRDSYKFCHSSQLNAPTPWTISALHHVQDLVVTPNEWLARFLVLDEGWQLPEQRLVIPNIVVSTTTPGLPAAASSNLQPVSELVFAGRLSFLKGLDVFCDAIDELLKNGGAFVASALFPWGRTLNVGCFFSCTGLLVCCSRYFSNITHLPPSFPSRRNCTTRRDSAFAHCHFLHGEAVGGRAAGCI